MEPMNSRIRKLLTAANVRRRLAVSIVLVLVAAVALVASLPWSSNVPSDQGVSSSGAPSTTGSSAADAGPVQLGLESGGIFTASGRALADGTRVSATDLSPISVDAGRDVISVKFVLDGAFLATDESAPYTIDLTPISSGPHRLKTTLQDDTGQSLRLDVEFDVTDSGGPASTSSSTPRPPASQQSSSASASHATSKTPTTPAAAPQPNPSGSKAVAVADAVSLQKALNEAGPGTRITLKDGNYNGKDVRDPTGKEPGRFYARVSGSQSAPIVLRGSRNAILDGGGTGGGYGFHLTGANYWRLEGFTVQSASKGIVLDNSSFNVIDGVQVSDIGDEGIHFRAFSSDNLLTNSLIENTGVDSPNYGEGVYIGSAQSNWGTYTGGQPDKSDRNQILNNRIIDTAAENLDIKEGSSSGIVRGNYFGGNKVASKNSADSWVDVKGNAYLIDGNHGVTSPRPNTAECGDPKGDPASTKNPFCDGFQVHVILSGWGQNNTFSNNILEVNAPGTGIWLQNTAVQNNTIKCSNQVTGAQAGPYAYNHYSALPCTP
jgi:Right handed beta helix region